MCSQYNSDQDAWKERNKGMRCKVCVFFVKKGEARCNCRGAIGRCRRNAPTMKGFPVVFEVDWCGEHRIDENKLNQE